MRRIDETFRAVLLAMLAAPAATMAGGPTDTAFSRVVGFGDSLSDPGNHFTVTGLQETAPYMPIPDASYAIGGHHFSNGDAWLEQLAQRLQLAPNGMPAFGHGAKFANYAIGGARARAAGVAPDLTTQVGRFVADNAGGSLTDDLVVVWIGANDVRDALGVLAANPSDWATAGAILNAAVEATAANVALLHRAGARRFLIPNVPDLAITPAVRSLGEPAMTAATMLSAGYNAGLDQALGALAALPGISFTRLDVRTLLSGIAADPESAGFAEAAVPCLRFGVIENAVCDRPEAHLFWDATHPTRAAHAILAEAALTAVGTD